MTVCLSIQNEKDKDIIEFLNGPGKSAKIKQCIRFWVKIQKKLEDSVVPDEVVGTVVKTNEDGSIAVKMPALRKIEITEDDLKKKLDGMF